MAGDGLLCTEIGGGGGPFSLTTDSVLSQLRVWVQSRDCIGGMELTFADGGVHRVGSKETSETRTLSLTPGEAITSLVMWAGPWMGHEGYHKLTLLTRIEMATSRGRTFVVGSTENCTRHAIPVGSGFIVGARGGKGDMLDRLGFVFLDTVKDVEAEIDGEVTVLPICNAQPGPEDARDNATQSDMLFTREYSWRYRSEHALRVSNTFDRDLASLRIKASVSYALSPFDTNAQAHLDMARHREMRFTGSHQTEEKEMKDTVQVTVPSGSRAVIRHSVHTISSSEEERTGKWIVTTVGGAQRKFPFKGTFIVKRTLAHAECTEMALR